MPGYLSFFSVIFFTISGSTQQYKVKKNEQTYERFLIFIIALFTQFTLYALAASLLQFIGLGAETHFIQSL